TVHTTTWDEVRTAAQGYAVALGEAGIRPGDHVALLGPTTIELITAIHGIWLAGATVMVLPLPMRLNSIELFIAQTRARLTPAAAPARAPAAPPARAARRRAPPPDPAAPAPAAARPAQPGPAERLGHAPPAADRSRAPLARAPPARHRPATRRGRHCTGSDTL